ncbi:hypothetical protein HK100_002788, partial [Physocladia obscura]
MNLTATSVCVENTGNDSDSSGDDTLNQFHQDWHKEIHTGTSVQNLQTSTRFTPGWTTSASILSNSSTPGWAHTASNSSAATSGP